MHDSEDGWHYTRTTDILPNLSVKLGQMIHDYTKPRSRIGDGPLDLPAGRTTTAVNEGSELISATQASSARFGMGVKLVHFLGVAFRGTADTGSAGHSTISQVQIDEFDPPQHYLQKSFDQPAVQEHLRREKSKKIYMICGIKTALRGATITNIHSRKRSGEAAVQLPLSPDGGTKSAKLSVTASLLNERQDTTDVQATHSFIFGYRLCRLVYDKKTNKVFSREVPRFYSQETDGVGTEEDSFVFTGVEYRKGYTLVIDEHSED